MDTVYGTHFTCRHSVQDDREFGRVLDAFIEYTERDGPLGPGGGGGSEELAIKRAG